MRASFGQLLQETRIKAVWSQRRVAAQLGVSVAQVSRIEAQRRPAPDEHAIVLLTRALGVSPWPMILAALRERGWTTTVAALTRMGVGTAQDYHGGNNGDDE